MTQHLSEDELILHYYGEIDRADEARIASHLASCVECQHANDKLRRVMTLVDAASPVEAPEGFERIAWARLEPQIEAQGHRKHRRLRSFFRFPQWAFAGGVAALLVAAFWAGRMSSIDPAHVAPAAGAMAQFEPDRVLDSALGDHLDRTQMMLVELANAETNGDVLSMEHQRAEDLVAANRVIRASAQTLGDAQVVDILEDLERVLLEIANAPANATSNDLTDLQSRITREDLLFRLRVIAQEMRQRNETDRATSGRRQPIS